MNSGGTNGEYILMHSEVNRLLYIVMLFLCVGGVLIGVLYYGLTEMLYYVHVESNGFLRDCTVGGYVGNGLDKRLVIAGAGNGWSAIKLCMELNRNVSHSSCNTGALLQVTDGKSG